MHCLKALLLATMIRSAVSFVVSTNSRRAGPGSFMASQTRLFEERASTTGVSASATDNSPAANTDNPHGLTPELLKIAKAFEAIGDDKLRYKQLLYMANQLKPLPDEYKIPENQVPGCLSTVHIHATVVDDGKIEYEGDSDGLLTKGLVALLVRGLNGNTPESIERVQPQFIQTAGIAASLTPGRNNGFLNMLAVMKQKARQAKEEQRSSSPSATKEDAASSSQTDDDGRPMYNAIVNELQKLQPVHLNLVDVSFRHAGHAGNDSQGGESHFELEIVAEAFDGLNLVKRHKLVYMMLGSVMPQIHALQISAKTPKEAGM